MLYEKLSSIVRSILCVTTASLCIALSLGASNPCGGLSLVMRFAVVRGGVSGDRPVVFQDV